PHGMLSLLRRRRVWTGGLLILLPPLLGAYAAVNVTGAARADHLAAWVGAASVVLFSVGNAGGRLFGGLVADHLGVDRVASVVGVPATLGFVVVVLRKEGLHG